MEQNQLNGLIAVWVILIILSAGAVLANEQISEQNEQPMGVWLVDINGIPLTQTAQIGKFTIFEVDGGT